MGDILVTNIPFCVFLFNVFTYICACVCVCVRVCAHTREECLYTHAYKCIFMRIHMYMSDIGIHKCVKKCDDIYTLLWMPERRMWSRWSPWMYRQRHHTPFSLPGYTQTPQPHFLAGRGDSLPYPHMLDLRPSTTVCKLIKWTISYADNSPLELCLVTDICYRRSEPLWRWQ